MPAARLSIRRYCRPAWAAKSGRAAPPGCGSGSASASISSGPPPAGSSCPGPVAGVAEPAAWAGRSLVRALARARSRTDTGEAASWPANSPKATCLASSQRGSAIWACRPAIKVGSRGTGSSRVQLVRSTEMAWVAVVVFPAASFTAMVT
jgi:hypothetical protein